MELLVGAGGLRAGAWWWWDVGVGGVDSGHQVAHEEADDVVR